MSSRFEDNIAWKKSRKLTRDIYLITKQGDFSRDFGLSGKFNELLYL